MAWQLGKRLEKQGQYVGVCAYILAAMPAYSECQIIKRWGLRVVARFVGS
jgi:hypothetical protein